VIAVITLYPKASIWKDSRTPHRPASPPVFSPDNAAPQVQRRRVARREKRLLAAPRQTSECDRSCRAMI
jgi:hypothetical protein